MRLTMIMLLYYDNTYRYTYQLNITRRFRGLLYLFLCFWLLSSTPGRHKVCSSSHMSFGYMRDVICQSHNPPQPPSPARVSHLFIEALKLLRCMTRRVNTEVLITAIQAVLAVVTHQAVRHSLYSSPACEQRRKEQKAQ